MNGQQKADPHRRELRKSDLQEFTDPGGMAHPLISGQAAPALDQCLAQRASLSEARACVALVGKDCRRQPDSHVICSKSVFFEKFSLP
ncbi:MAG: hypothetical protein IPK44_12535 [Candidatus Accumulibacter sp.]|uniref:hypothetical protein n=1 Tax=Accumulibacter sp. TaxID=2053492 RepID=UPI00258817D3|nr:hypothetical protein [Accumulibacter sp.]MBK8115298.1 hypothetical protein [Accumulibacter sp.]